MGILLLVKTVTKKIKVVRKGIEVVIDVFRVLILKIIKTGKVEERLGVCYWWLVRIF